MIEHFRDGGWGMWPTLLFGLVVLGTALRFAVTVDGRLEGFIESTTRAVLFFGLTGFVTGLIATVGALQSNEGLWKSDGALILLVGTKESANNLALAFTFASLAHLLVAVGRRRRDARAPAAS